MLGSEDLAVREAGFPAVVERARWELEARAFLDELSCSSEVQLAWTARLALRGLDRPPIINLHLAEPIAIGVGEFSLQIAQQIERELGRFLNPSLAFLTAGRAAPSAAEGSAPRSTRVTVVEAELSGSPDGEAAAGVEAVSPRPEPSIVAPDDLLEQLSLEQLELARALRERISRGGCLDDRTRGLVLHRQGPRGTARGGAPLDRLGVQVAEVLPSGVRLFSVPPGTLAEALRLNPGDVLVELCGRVLREPDDIGRALAERLKDAPITMRCLERGLIQRSAVWAAPRTAPEAPAESPAVPSQDVSEKR